MLSVETGVWGRQEDEIQQSYGPTPTARMHDSSLQCRSKSADQQPQHHPGLWELNRNTESLHSLPTRPSESKSIFCPGHWFANESLKSRILVAHIVLNRNMPSSWLFLTPKPDKGSLPCLLKWWKPSHQMMSMEVSLTLGMGPRQVDFISECCERLAFLQSHSEYMTTEVFPGVSCPYPLDIKINCFHLGTERELPINPN